MPIQRVTSGVIADGAIVATDIADGTVTGPKLGANSVSSNNIIASVTLTTPRVSGNLNLDSTGTTGIRVPSANTIAFHTTGTEDMRIDATGNVGIGTASPDTRLTVASGGRGRFYRSDNTRYGDIYTDGDALKIESSTDPIVINAATGQGIRFQDAGTERMRITGDGNVGIGSNNPSQKLHVDGGSGMSSSALIARFFGTSGNSMLIRGSGNVENTNGSYGAISDAKLKENIVDASPKLDKLMQVKVRNYNLIGNELKQIGVIAQELEQVFPSMISEDEDGTKSVKYSIFVPMLIKAIQELKAELDTAKQRITDLENANK